MKSIIVVNFLLTYIILFYILFLRGLPYPPPSLIWRKEVFMKILSTYSKLDRNDNPYILVVFSDSKGKERKIVLNHYDLEYSMKGKIKYEISKQNKK